MSVDSTVERNNRPVNVGLIGMGNIGTGVARYFLEGRGEPLNIHLTSVAVQDLSKPREVQFPNLTADASRIIKNPTIDIVVELMGGMNPARDFMLDAINRGKSVVTGNKTVLAKDMKEMFEAAQSRSVDLGFEASVGGGIPIIGIINSYRGQRIDRLLTIINGTTNYILSNMEAGFSYQSSLINAQGIGVAEADPSRDIEGLDARDKLAILASLIWNAPTNVEEIACTGITNITPETIASAQRQHGTIKLLATATREEDTVVLSVAPTFLKRTHQLTLVTGTFNAVYIEGDLSGPQLFWGKGAGEGPTTNAVISDIIRVARNRRTGVPDDLPTLDSKIRFISPVQTASR